MTRPSTPNSNREEAQVLARLRAAVVARDEARTARWLRREIGPDGSPSRISIAASWESLRLLVEAARPSDLSAYKTIRTGVEPLVGWLSQMSRADGSSVLEPPRPRPERLGLLGAWERPGSSGVGKGSIASRTKVLACLRPEDTADGFAAVEAASGGLRVEGQGGSWLGGVWNMDPEGDSRPTGNGQGEGADVYEWAATVEGRRVQGVIAILRQGGAALLGGVSWGPLRVPLGEGVAVRVLPTGVARLERAGRSARVYRIGADSSRIASGLSVDESQLIVGADEPTGRRFRAVLVCWDRLLKGIPATLRPLTVTEGGRTCRPSRAFAARISWGRGRDGLVVYRSLSGPTMRAFLGCPTKTRFLLGRFTPEGDLRPLVCLD